jgi:MoaA/NifB/PqqE/SkfB family radical SAM enzyme
MDVALFEKIVREVSLHRSFRWFKLLGLGEAAIHSRFRELMAVLVHHPIPTMAYTNGSLLRLYPHREILSWGFKTLVVSIDGIDAEDYARIRVGGNYASLRKAVMDFYQCRNSSGGRSPVIEIRHVIMPNETATQLLQFRKTWMECADSVKFQSLGPQTGLLDFEVPIRPKCRPIRREMGIWWDGTAPLCMGYWRDSLGNVRDSTIAELWRHPRLENMRECHERRDFAPVPLCLRCPGCGEAIAFASKTGQKPAMAN